MIPVVNGFVNIFFILAKNFLFNIPKYLDKRWQYKYIKYER